MITNLDFLSFCKSSVKINGILLPKLFWSTLRKKCLVIVKNFWNLRLKSVNDKTYSVDFFYMENEKLSLFNFLFQMVCRSTKDLLGEKLLFTLAGLIIGDDIGSGLSSMTIFFLFSLNQQSAAQKSEPVLLPVGFDVITHYFLPFN